MICGCVNNNVIGSVQVIYKIMDWINYLNLLKTNLKERAQKLGKDNNP